MKISILLPYKENFSSKYAGAVSLFVKDTTIYSRYKNSIKITPIKITKIVARATYLSL